MFNLAGDSSVHDSGIDALYAIKRAFWDVVKTIVQVLDATPESIRIESGLAATSETDGAQQTERMLPTETSRAQQTESYFRGHMV